MIPPFNYSGVLPPFVGGDPRDPTQVSPYDTSMENLVDRYATTPERRAILNGLCSLRDRFRTFGIVEGYQWLCGSCTENIEILENRPPGDIDVITFAYRPTHIMGRAEWLQFFRDNRDFFNPDVVKHHHMCHAFYVDLNKPPHLIVADTSYWFGLFSHRRDGVWKGMLRVGLRDDGVIAKAKLGGATS